VDHEGRAAHPVVVHPAGAPLDEEAAAEAVGAGQVSEVVQMGEGDEVLDALDARLRAFERRASAELGLPRSAP
jgi:predicted phosphoribosyltransferase